MTDLPQSFSMAYARLEPRERPSAFFPKLIQVGRVLLAAMCESRRRQAQAELARHPHLMSDVMADAAAKAAARAGTSARESAQP